MGFQETVFAQLMKQIDHNVFKRCVGEYQGDYRTRSFSCQDQFLCMAFAQLARKKSLRDTIFSLRQMGHKLYHMGIKGSVSLSALSDANTGRNWRIWQDFAQTLIPKARALYADEPISVDEDLKASVYALDSTTIDLCMSVFPWADFRTTKAGIKLHTQIDIRGKIPVFIHISEAKMSDVLALDLLILEALAVYLMDRGYLDFARLYRIEQAKAFFVTRSKDNTRFYRQYSRRVDRTTGLICDQIGILVLKKAGRLTQLSCAA